MTLHVPSFPLHAPAGDAHALEAAARSFDRAAESLTASAATAASLPRSAHSGAWTGIAADHSAAWFADRAHMTQAAARCLGQMAFAVRDLARDVAGAQADWHAARASFDTLRSRALHAQAAALTAGIAFEAVHFSFELARFANAGAHAVHRYESAAARASERLEAAAMGLRALDFEHDTLTAVKSTPIRSLAIMFGLGLQFGIDLAGRFDDAALVWRLRERWGGWRLGNNKAGVIRLNRIKNDLFSTRSGVRSPLKVPKALRGGPGVLSIAGVTQDAGDAYSSFKRHAYVDGTVSALKAVGGGVGALPGAGFAIGLAIQADAVIIQNHDLVAEVFGVNAINTVLANPDGASLRNLALHAAVNPAGMLVSVSVVGGTYAAVGLSHAASTAWRKVFH